MLQGEIYIADPPGQGRRPVLVVSRELLNRGAYVLVAVITSAHFERRKVFANCVPLRAGQFGLTLDCVVQCENIASIHKDDIDHFAGALGKLDDETMRAVIESIGYVIESHCQPV